MNTETAQAETAAIPSQSDAAAPAKIVIKHRYTKAVLFEFQPTEEQQSSGLAMRAALEAATKGGANLRGAYLDGANLRGADLRGADLDGAYLGGAYLRGADLDGAYLGGADLDGAYLGGAYLGGANLRGANLRGAYLGGAYLGGDKTLIGERPVFTVGPIGSRSDFFVAYITDKGLYLRAGCFFGTVIEFTSKLSETHGTNEHAQEYAATLELIQCHARLWTPVPEVAKDAAAVGADHDPASIVQGDA